MGRAESSSGTASQSRLVSSCAVLKLAFVSALLGERYAAPVAAFCATTSSRAFASRSGGGGGAAARRSCFELFGIKRKVKVDLQENFSGKVVDTSGPMSGMLGGDANGLFEVIERNKKKDVEAAAVAEAARHAAEEGASDKNLELEGADGGDDDEEGHEEEDLA